jgi:hypothetical protein
MALTEEERQKVRYHLGYMSVTAAVQITYGVAKPAQTLFLVELAMNNLMPVAEDKVRQLIGILDGIECRLVDAQERLAASSIDQLKMRADEPDALEHEYYRWGGRLADTLGVPFYAYSNRYKSGGQTKTVSNVAVRG